MKKLLSFCLLLILVACGPGQGRVQEKDVLKDGIVKFNSLNTIDKHCVRGSSQFRLTEKMFNKILYVTVACKKDLPGLGNPRHVELKYSYVLLLLI